MQDTLKTDQLELMISSPRWLKWVMGFCMTTAVGMFAIWTGAYLEEGWSSVVVWTGGVFLLIFALAIYLTAATFQSFHFFADRVEWRRGWQTIAFPYPAITAAVHGDRLQIRTRRARYSVFFPIRDIQHQIHEALIQRVPVLKTARQAESKRPLPIVWRPRLSARLTNIFFFLFLGPGFLFFGGGAFYYALTSEKSFLENAGAYLVGGLAIPIALLMIWLFASEFVWSITFDQEELRVRHLLENKSYPIPLLKKMTVDHEIRTYRGISREAWFLLFDFADGRSFKFEPTENGIANGFTPQFDRDFLTRLRQTLMFHYFSTSTTPSPLPPSAYPEDEWGRPERVYTETADLYNFSLTTLNYGEQSMGAERIHFVLSRPLGGLTRLKTVNGRAVFSPNRRYVAIIEPFHLVIFDLATDRVYRPRERREWFYHNAHFDDRYVHIELRYRVDHNQKTMLKPLPLDQLDEILELQAPDKPRLGLPADRLTAVLDELRLWPEDKLAYEFETARDDILGLGLAIAQPILDEVNQPRNRALQELLITILADLAYPPALPYFVEWLTHPNEQIRFVAAMALDQFAGGRFAIEKMIAGGWVQHNQISTAVPQIQTWWRETGRHQIPSTAAWLAEREQQRPATDQEKRFNFVELNPDWVMQGDGVVAHPQAGYVLPRNKGIHIVAGEAILQGEPAPQFAVVEIDSHTAEVIGVYSRIDGAWREVTALVEQVTPVKNFASS